MFDVYLRLVADDGDPEAVTQALGVAPDESTRHGRPSPKTGRPYGFSSWTLALGRAVAPRFPNLRFLTFAAAVPSGLASRKDFAEHELLDFDQLRTLVSREHVERLRSLAPRSVQLMTSNNMILMMHPELVKRHGFPMLQVEPDGEVRAMPIYEGTVGNLLTEDAGTLWERVQERWSDPFVVETLSAVRSMQDWAEATRRLDYHFGTDEVRRRIDRRPPYTLDDRTSDQRHIASMTGPASGHQL
ncbi:hypothetical protein [Nonomuraea wenchangensis]|uniref:hypothetical protein n=1 Tax=Nonomuraea wenchangensis TaxID=568860 RepID=UPI0033E8111F